MKYSLLRESRVLVVYEGRVFEFDALSSLSANLDYQEVKMNRKTIHKKSNYPYSRVVSKNPTSISLAVNLTDNCLEENFFKWLGMEKLGTLLYMPFNSKIEPTYIDMYIITPDNSGLFIERCYVSFIDLTLEKSVPVLSISIEGANCKRIADYPSSGSLIQGNIVKTSPLWINVNNKDMPAVNGAGISFQQQCSWRDTRTLHDVGNMYYHKNAYINEMNASATLNFNLVENAFSSTNMDPEYYIPVSIYTKYLEINFPSSRIMKRLSVTDVYSLSMDIIPMEDSEDNPVTIKLFGVNND